MIRLFAFASIALALVAPAAFGQSTNPASPAPGNPGGMPPGTRQSIPGVPAPHQTNQADRAFVHAATVGGLAEVELGRLAAQKASNRTVKEFAERMVRDHGAANDRLSTLVKADKSAPSDKLDEEHQAMRARLEQSSGAQFDNAYMQGQVTEHQKTAQLLEYEIGSGGNAELKEFASDLLPTVLAHLRMAQAIASEMAHQATAELPTKEAPREGR
jgi:putative membrane protein